MKMSGLYCRPIFICAVAAKFLYLFFLFDYLFFFNGFYLVGGSYFLIPNLSHLFALCMLSIVCLQSTPNVSIVIWI